MRTFNYKEIADCISLKPHSVRAWASKNKISSSEIPEDKAKEYIEIVIKRLEEKFKKDDSFLSIYVKVRKNYKSVFGYDWEGSIGIEDIQRIKETLNDKIDSVQGETIVGLPKILWGIPEKMKPKIVRKDGEKLLIYETDKTKIIIHR